MRMTKANPAEDLGEFTGFVEENFASLPTAGICRQNAALKPESLRN